MKKNRFTEFFKGKGYYVLLFVGVVAIAAVAVIGSQLSTGQDQENNYVDLNDVGDNIAADDGDTQLAENNPISEGIVNNANDASDDSAVANDDTAANTAGEVAEGETASNQIELEGYAEENTGADYTQTDEAGEEAQVADDSAETSTASAQNESSETISNLSFNKEDGLMWPVMGNVIMNYSMEHTIYFATLMQYQCNPALIIDAEVGAEVKAAATGVVTSIDTENEETGLTVTMDIGDGYSVVYGQLTASNFKVGDLVNEGTVIGTVAEPTKYYTVEGSNLYFEVMQNNETVDPMLLLR